MPRKHVTEDQVIGVFKRRANGQTMDDIASHMPFSHMMVADILNGNRGYVDSVPEDIREKALAFHEKQRKHPSYRVKRKVTSRELSGTIPHDTKYGEAITNYLLARRALSESQKRLEEAEAECDRYGVSEDTRISVRLDNDL